MLLRLALIVLLCAGSACAEETRQAIKLADLPSAVRETVKLQQAGGNLLRLEKIVREGIPVYELEFSNGAARKIVVMDATGKVLEIRQPVKLTEVSKAARAVIESSVGKGKFISLESVKTEAGIVAAYQVQFELESKKTLLRIRPDGSLAQE
ncbi:MAG: hypothetical protein ABLQ96_05655 [Candidatus Acidiferrum sp.]